MVYKATKLKVFLGVASLLIAIIPSPTFGFGMKGGGGGGSAVAEILAAGLITGLLMESRPAPRPVIRALIHHPIIGGYNMMPHHARHSLHALLSGRMPAMMHHYNMPTMQPRPRFIMNPHHALISHAAKHQAMTARLNQEIRALEAQESMLEALLEQNQQSTNLDPAIAELLAGEEDTIPAAALLLETAELVNQEGGLDKTPLHITHPEIFQAAGSEAQSRYILPRIVRHFVQRLMRRGEHH